MNVTIPVRRVVAAFLGLVFTVVAFLVLNASFGGPGPSPKPGFVLVTRVTDAQNLVRKSLVMVRGVRVGEVTDVQVRGNRAVVRLAVENDLRLTRGTQARVAHRTAFGEAYVDLMPGARDGLAVPSGSQIRTVETVDADEALAVVGPKTREHARDLTVSLAKGLGGADSAARLRAAITAANRTTAELSTTARALRGQEDDLATLVSGGAAVMATLREHDTALTRVVSAGRSTGDALARRTREIQRTATSYAQVSREAEAAIAAAQPMLRDAEPRVRRLASRSADVRRGIEAAGPVVRQTAAVAAEAKPALAALLPMARRLGALTADLDALAEQAPATIANGMASLQWVTNRSLELSTAVAALRDVFDRGDSDGRWVHMFASLSLDQLLGYDSPCTAKDPSAFCVNPYPAPNETFDPKPYKKGQMERLVPFKP
ncbi:MAG: MCE family protein [Solirubrobacteraceae bacterium]|nr:MCE family protein [Solirubrobacteraceae bacterium]